MRPPTHRYVVLKREGTAVLSHIWVLHTTFLFLSFFLSFCLYFSLFLFLFFTLSLSLFSFLPSHGTAGGLWYNDVARFKYSFFFTPLHETPACSLPSSPLPSSILPLLLSSPLLYSHVPSWLGKGTDASSQVVFIDIQCLSQQCRL